MLFQYIENIMVIGPSEQDVATTFDSLLRQMMGNKCHHVQGNSTLVKFLGVQ